MFEIGVPVIQGRQRVRKEIEMRAVVNYGT